MFIFIFILKDNEYVINVFNERLFWMKKILNHLASSKGNRCSCRKVKQQVTNLTNPSLKTTWTVGV